VRTTAMTGFEGHKAVRGARSAPPKPDGRNDL
jgi:hypothetical protein